MLKVVIVVILSFVLLRFLWLDPTLGRPIRHAVLAEIGRWAKPVAEDAIDEIAGDFKAAFAENSAPVRTISTTEPQPVVRYPIFPIGTGVGPDGNGCETSGPVCAVAYHDAVTGTGLVHVEGAFTPTRKSSMTTLIFTLYDSQNRPVATANAYGYDLAAGQPWQFHGYGFDTGKATAYRLTAANNY